MRTRKALLVMLSIVLTFSVLLMACTKKEDPPKQAEKPPVETGKTTPTDQGKDATPEPEPPTQIKVALTTGNSQYVEGMTNINEDIYLKKLEELSNTDLELELIPHENYDQSMTLLLAGGVLPDLLQTKGINKPEIAPAIDAGVLLPLNDLIEQYGPNLSKHVPAASWASDRVSKDGVIYGIPQENPILNSTVVYIRQDWLDELKLEVPKTVEEYIDVLRAFKASDPNRIPFSGRANFSHTFHFFGAYDAQPQTWKFIDGQLVPTFTLPQTIDALKTYRLLYDEKLLDNEFLTQQGKDWDAKIKGAGNVGMWAHSSAAPDSWEVAIQSNHPEARIANIPAPVGPSGNPGGIYALGSTVSDFVWTIPKDAKNPEGIIKFLDWYYSEGNEERDTFFMYGLEGKNYTLENGAIKYIYPTTNEEVGEQNQHQEWYRFTGGKPHLTDETYLKGKPKGDLIFHSLQVAANEGLIDDGLDIPTMPTMQARPELNWNGLWLEFAAKVITGKESVDKFDEFVTDWKKRGGDDLIKEATEWYNAQHN